MTTVERSVSNITNLAKEMIIRSLVLTLVQILIILHYVIARNNENDSFFKFPEYTVEAFYPKGLRVSIPHKPGIILFAFHGNVNKMLESVDAGDLSRDIVKRTGSRWVFEDRNVILHENDVLYFWLYVIKSGLGFKSNDIMYKIRRLSPQPESWQTPAYQVPRQPKPKPSYQPDKPVLSPTLTEATTSKDCYCSADAKPCTLLPTASSTTTIESNVPQMALPTITSPTNSPTSPTETHMPEPSIKDKIVSIWTGSLNNATEEKIHLTNQIHRLTAENLHLISIIQHMNSSDMNKVIISGRIPQSGDPEDFIRSVLREKLLLKDRFASGERNPDGTITLEMENFMGKLNVIFAAKEKMKNSQIVIEDALIRYLKMLNPPKEVRSSPRYSVGEDQMIFRD